MSRNRLVDLLERTERELWVIGAVGYGMALLGSLMPLAHSFYLRSVLGPAGPSMLTAAAFSALMVAVYCFAHWRSRAVFQRALGQSKLMEAIAAGDASLEGFSQLAAGEADERALKSQMYRLGQAVGLYLSKNSSSSEVRFWLRTRVYGLVAPFMIQLAYTYSFPLGDHIQQLIASNAMSIGQMFYSVSLFVLAFGWVFSFGYPISDLTMRYLRRELVS